MKRDVFFLDVGKSSEIIFIGKACFALSQKQNIAWDISQPCQLRDTTKPLSPWEVFCSWAPFALPAVFFHPVRGNERGAGDNHQHHLTPATPVPHLPSKSPGSPHQEPSQIIIRELPGSPCKWQVGGQLTGN